MFKRDFNLTEIEVEVNKMTPSFKNFNQLKLETKAEQENSDFLLPMSNPLTNRLQS